jgi:hypothetical protein
MGWWFHALESQARQASGSRKEAPIRLQLALTTSLALTLPAAAQLISTGAPALLPDSPTADYSTFATRMDLHADWMAVGADHDLASMSGIGEVMLFTRAGSGWVQRQRLTAPDGFNGDHFGLPVLLGDGILAVGAPCDDDLGFWSGSVYVYRLVNGNWAFEAKLLPVLANNTYALFGLSLSFGVDENELIVGSYLESTDGYMSGAVYVFGRTLGTWTVTQRLALPIAQPAAYFGRSVAVDGDRLAVGVSGATTGAIVHPHGAVSLFRHDGTTWLPDGGVLPPDPVAFQAFGEWVAMAGDQLVVASPGEVLADGDSQGVAYVFETTGSTWTLNARIEPPESLTTAFSFPAILSPDNRYLFLGAYSSDLDGAMSGAAWIYQRMEDTFAQPVRLACTNPHPGDFFGLAAEFDDASIYVGAPRLDLAGPDGGGVFKFDLADCDDSGVLDAWEIAAGDVADADGNGIPDACDGSSPDLNNDGIVNGGDIGIIMGAWGTDGSIGGDIDGDGRVDGADLAHVLAGWG